MKKFVSIFIVVSLVALVFFSPAIAQSFEEEVYIFQTVDDPAVPYDPEVLEQAPFWGNQVLYPGEWDAVTPPPNVVPLGASLWAINTRSKDGKVVKQKVRQIGTGTAVAVITNPLFPPLEPSALAPFYFEASIGDLDFTANGKCIVTNNLLNSLGIVLVGCDLEVYPDFSQGIIGGNATSNSVFNLGNPDFQTGSFWTLRLFRQ